MIGIAKACKSAILILVLFTALFVSGCEGTSSRDKVDDTVKELAGKKKLDQMEQMKKDVGTAVQQQADRFKKTEKSAEEK